MYAFATMFPASGGFQSPDLLHVVTSADLRHPRGLAMDFLANELYVCDSAHHRVQVLSVETKGLVLQTPTARALTGGLSFPCGVDISHYHVVVADTGHGRLAIFTKRGLFVAHLGSKGRAPGQFWDPRDVKLANVRKNAVNRGTLPTTKGLNEHFEIVVADTGNYRIQVLRDDGSVVYIFSQHADATSLERHVGTFKQLTTALLRCLDHVGLHHMATAVAAGGPFAARRRLPEYLHPSSITFATVSSLLQQLADEKRDLRCPTALDLARNHQNAITFVDRDNARVCSYHYAGPKFEWAALPRHANVLKHVAGAVIDGTTAYVVDSLMHRVAIYEHVAVTPAKWEWTPTGFLGAATYGNKIECAPGCHLGELQSPTAVALYAPNAATRWVLVSDSGNHRIQVFDAVTRRALHVLGSFGHRANGLDAPLGLSIFEGDVYCADQRNHRVAVFNIASTTPLGTYGTFGSRPGEFALPTDVAVVPALPQYDGIDLGPHRDAKMVVSDTGNYRVQVLSLVGTPLFVFEHMAQGVRMVPMGLYVDAATGHILVCDVSAHAGVLLFTPDGRLFHSFGGTLPGADRLQRPVTVVRAGEGFVVADASRLDLCSFATTR
ncbi:hypothetical protein, variant [Saprolegnia diclina VS20]|nr:hypothetical protein, variant [Saprolegnia diclina VS20]EQC39816.1 hypothetical protein, variant [Saprolegnia diclina VS20]|eukprot:XP_008607088.1 hypothetical protein, variant [Saprolegnia diclina VS20]